jgi:hypothetical protein
VISFVLSYQRTGQPSDKGSLNVDLLPDTALTCRYSLLLPDPAGQYDLQVEGELETLKYATAGWQSAGSGATVDLGELRARP